MISIIVAMSENNIIGNQGKIPWKIKGEQKRFRELTVGNTIIMGRKSFEEIGHPLPNRKTIVISKSKVINEENCITVNSFTKALEITKNCDEVFIAGGGEIYKEALPVTDRIYLTIVHKKIEGDVSFAPINKDNFVKTYEKTYEGDTSYTYYTYERKVQK